jgi:protein TonB
MKKTSIFLILSLSLHLPLLFLTFHPAEKKTENVIPVDIIKKEKVQPPTVQTAPKTQPDFRPAPPSNPKTTPIPGKTIPINPLPKDNTISQDNGENGEEQKNTQRPPIIPKKISPDKIPPPMTLNELLREQKNSELFGPDRNIRDIVKDYLKQPQLPADEDSVSFNNMSEKYESYFYKFARALYGIWRYPPDAAKRGESGIVRVTFAINKDGSVTDINMIESSGYPALDREVMRTLRSMPKVALPESHGLNVLHVNGYFIYTLTGDYRLY